MTEKTVWYSAAFTDTRIRLVDLSVMCHDIAGEINTGFQDNQITELIQKYTSGQSLGRIDIPNKYCCNYRDVKIKNIPEFCYVNGFILISEEYADVFKQFDLGTGGIFPVKIYQWDRMTLFNDSPRFVIDFGAVKNAFCLSKSNQGQLEKIGPRDNPRWMPWTIADDDMAMSSRALVGADLWQDPLVANSIFLSDRLASALRAKKLDKRLTLSRCRIVDG